MRVCAEFEHHEPALAAHRHLVDQGVNPNDIEIRSPYPLPEHPIPPHRSSAMWMRSVVRTMWAFGLSFGFLFVSYTQFEWGPAAMTNGHPLIAPPIVMIPTYECGMITAILTTTFMFFLETFRYRKLVPPIEEDLPVGIGYVVVIVAGASAEKALKLFEGRGARSIVTYCLLFAILMFTQGCARNNMREQDAKKPTEIAGEYPPEHSMRMPTKAEQAVPAPAPFGSWTAGDVKTYDEFIGLNAQMLGLNNDKNMPEDQKKPLREKTIAAMGNITARLTAEDGMPMLYRLKGLGAPPKELLEWKNPVKDDAASRARGEHLYKVNCAACHGVEGKGDGKVGAVEYIQPPALGNAQQYESKADGYFYYYAVTGKNLMPSFGYKLTPADFCDIINHIRGLQGKAASN